MRAINDRLSAYRSLYTVHRRPYSKHLLAFLRVLLPLPDTNTQATGPLLTTAPPRTENRPAHGINLFMELLRRRSTTTLREAGLWPVNRCPMSRFSLATGFRVAGSSMTLEHHGIQFALLWCRGCQSCQIAASLSQQLAGLSRAIAYLRLCRLCTCECETHTVRSGSCF